MARNKGGFKKILSLMGIVDNERQDYADNYDQGYARTSAAARPSTYVPQQQRARTADTRSRTPATAAGRYSQPSNYNEGYTVRRTERAYETENEPAPSMQRRAAETRQPAPRPAATARYNAPGTANAPAPRAPGTPRTIMCPISTLEECCDVIDIIVENNIVLLMLDNMDPALTQRAVDLLSGATFALRATIKKASERTYLIAPRTVTVSENDELSRRY